MIRQCKFVAIFRTSIITILKMVTWFILGTMSFTVMGLMYNRVHNIFTYEIFNRTFIQWFIDPSWFISISIISGFMILAIVGLILFATVLYELCIGIRVIIELIKLEVYEDENGDIIITEDDDDDNYRNG